MNKQQMLMMLRGLQPDELLLIEDLIKDMSESEQQQFFTIYQGSP
jgi:hypothetical protein